MYNEILFIVESGVIVDLIGVIIIIIIELQEKIKNNKKLNRLHKM